MKNSYLKRITNGQIAKFLERQYPEDEGYSFEFVRDNVAIYVRIEHKASYELNSQLANSSM